MKPRLETSSQIPYRTLKPKECTASSFFFLLSLSRIMAAAGLPQGASLGRAGLCLVQSDSAHSPPGEPHSPGRASSCLSLHCVGASCIENRVVPTKGRVETGRSPDKVYQIVLSWLLSTWEDQWFPQFPLRY